MILETLIIFKLFPQIPFSECTELHRPKLVFFHKVNESIEILNNFEFKEHFSLTEREENLMSKIMTHYNMAPKLRESCFSYVMLSYALDIETCSILKDMEMNDVELKMQHVRTSFKMDTQFKDDDWKMFSICLIPMESFKNLSYKSTIKTYYGIKNYNKKGIISFDETTCRSKKKETKIDIKKLYHISFLSDSVSYHALVDALISMKSRNLQNYFLEFEVAPVKCPKVYINHQKIERFKWLDKRVATNKEQMMAIKNIVNCTAYPFPFIIFGPPGTGKTSTLIECIAQILQHKPHSRILITAQSNSACDEIGGRLIKAIDRKKVFRLYSTSQLQNQQSTEVRTELLKISNIRNKCLNDVTYEQIYHFNVVIATLMKTYQLIKAKLTNEYYDYIFIDECASAAETECLVPILGKIDNNQIILTSY